MCTDHTHNRHITLVLYRLTLCHAPVVVGFRDDNAGQLKQVERYKTQDLPRFVRGKQDGWDPQVQSAGGFPTAQAKSSTGERNRPQIELGVPDPPMNLWSESPAPETRASPPQTSQPLDPGRIF